jgi:hypothetical protein
MPTGEQILFASTPGTEIKTQRPLSRHNFAPFQNFAVDVNDVIHMICSAGVKAKPSNDDLTREFGRVEELLLEVEIELHLLLRLRS